jgi:hypothetical protein
VREPTSVQLTQLARTIARRVGRLLEREGFLERGTEQIERSEDSELKPFSCFALSLYSDPCAFLITVEFLKRYGSEA